jgi:hypothetical protein
MVFHLPVLPCNIQSAWAISLALHIRQSLHGSLEPHPVWAVIVIPAPTGFSGIELGSIHTAWQGILRIYRPGSENSTCLVGPVCHRFCIPCRWFSLDTCLDHAVFLFPGFGWHPPSILLLPRSGVVAVEEDGKFCGIAFVFFFYSRRFETIDRERRTT